VRFERALQIGGQTYRAVLGEAEYVLLARLSDAERQRPAFLICGQTAITNHAAARYLASHHRGLLRRYGLQRVFCLLLKVVRSDAYGPDVVELVGDVTAEATSPPPDASADLPPSAPAAGDFAEPSTEAPV
jgi:hypothetical protein